MEVPSHLLMTMGETAPQQLPKPCWAHLYHWPGSGLGPAALHFINCTCSPTLAAMCHLPSLELELSTQPLSLTSTSSAYSTDAVRCHHGLQPDTGCSMQLG